MSGGARVVSCARLLPVLASVGVSEAGAGSPTSGPGIVLVDDDVAERVDLLLPALWLGEEPVGSRLSKPDVGDVEVRARPCDSPGTPIRSSLAVDIRNGLASSPLATQIRALGSRTAGPWSRRRGTRSERSRARSRKFRGRRQRRPRMNARVLPSVWVPAASPKPPSSSELPQPARRRQHITAVSAAAAHAHRAPSLAAGSPPSRTCGVRRTRRLGRTAPSQAASSARFASSSSESCLHGDLLLSRSGFPGAPRRRSDRDALPRGRPHDEPRGHPVQPTPPSVADGRHLLGSGVRSAEALLRLVEASRSSSARPSTSCDWTDLVEEVFPSLQQSERLACDLVCLVVLAAGAGGPAPAPRAPERRPEANRPRARDRERRLEMVDGLLLVAEEQREPAEVEHAAGRRCARRSAPGRAPSPAARSCARGRSGPAAGRRSRPGSRCSRSRAGRPRSCASSSAALDVFAGRVEVALAPAAARPPAEDVGAKEVARETGSLRRARAPRRRARPPSRRSRACSGRRRAGRGRPRGRRRRTAGLRPAHVPAGGDRRPPVTSPYCMQRPRLARRARGARAPARRRLDVAAGRARSARSPPRSDAPPRAPRRARAGPRASPASSVETPAARNAGSTPSRSASQATVSSRRARLAALDLADVLLREASRRRAASASAPRRCAATARRSPRRARVRCRASAM